MADETTPIETSTTTPQADDAAAAPVVADTEAGTETVSDAPEAAGSTALGGDDAADAPDTAAEATVPEAYELTAPEGLTLDPASIELATPVFKDLGLTNEQAQKLMPVAGEFATKIAAGIQQKIEGDVVATRAKWLTDAKSDAEIGGGKWDESLATAAKGLDHLGFPKGSPFRALLNESGLGNHPDMIRAFARVGKAIGEDSFVRSDQGASVAKTDAELFYPNMKSK